MKEELGFVKRHPWQMADKMRIKGALRKREEEPNEDVCPDASQDPALTNKATRYQDVEALERLQAARPLTPPKRLWPRGEE